ncbi:HAD family hydrolase [Microcoleus sp. FACHB-672]|uniref:HAD family hydrolase n=1 Tax=Microcoleus sp. FACHB-672 TaxID=2692825 RepID=UPI0016884535|nr:HAD-IA family hydrolase [Microcoleus sp. FACHB-672]MBD2040211.1 HAD-IA family hydrolase [Microcoleus sp. FACHB-672]
MLAAILFDLDGTLANTDPIHFLTWQELLRSHDLEIDQAFYKSRISGRLNPVIVQDILPHLTESEGKQVADEKEAHFRRLATELQCLPGLPDVIAWIDERRLQRALVTNAPRANAEFMLEVLELIEIFPQVILAEDGPAGKPDPAPYLLALSRLGVKPEEALAFEDSPSGIRSAVAAGIYTIGIASTHPPQNLFDVGAAMVIPDFTDSQLWSFLRASERAG